jgi:hypothetical protein
MASKKRVWTALVIAPLFAGLLAAPAVSFAATKHIKCQTEKNGKTTTQMVTSSAKCTDMGGKVIATHKK